MGDLQSGDCKIGEWYVKYGDGDFAHKSGDWRLVT